MSCLTRLMSKCANDIIGFKTIKLDQWNAKQLNHAMNVGNLHSQIIIHRWAVCLIAVG